MKKYLIIALFICVSAQAENNTFLKKIDKDQDKLLSTLKDMNGKSTDIQKTRKNTIATHTLEELHQIKKTKKEKKLIRKNKVTKKKAKAIRVGKIKNVNSTKTNKIKHSSIKDKGLKKVGISTNPSNKSKLNVSVDQAYRDAVKEME